MKSIPPSLVSIGLTTLALVGCGAQPAADEAAPADVAVQQSALDLSNYKSVGQVICDIVDNLPGGNIGGVNITPPSCTFTNYDNLYYFGSITNTFVIGPGHTNPSQRPAAMADAVFCALKDADGASTDATAHTSLGRFGMASRISVWGKDPAARQVAGQRIGTLYVFGVPLDIDNEDFVAGFPIESFAGGLLSSRTNGYYMDLQTSTTQWHMGGSGVLGPFTLSLSFGQNGYFKSLENNGFAFTSKNNHGGSDPGNAWNPQFSYDSWPASCNSCRASGAAFCDCPSQSDIAQHNKFVNWSDDQYRNLGDKTLPYFGAIGGVSGKSRYVDTSNNWTQLGFANGGSQASDPTHSANNNGDRSTYLDFSFGLDYSIISLDLELGVGFRSGMELTQGSYFANEFKDHYATVGVGLDAESRAKLDAHLVLRNPFPFGPDVLLDETFDIFNAANTPPTTQAARLEYDYANGFPFSTYNTAATGNRTDAQAAHDACLAVPPAQRAPEQPGNPQSFLQGVTNAAQSNLFPCHVKICTIGGANDGELETCEWDRTQKKLVCTQTTQPCDCRANSADLCDAAGNVYTADPATRKVSGCAPPK
jgi:hypothetical protein